MTDQVKRYRKIRPEIIQAIKWTGDNLWEVIIFTGWHESESSLWTWEEYEKVVAKRGLKIFGPQGPIEAEIGEYIIKNSKGDCYPCMATYFHFHYKEIEIKNEREVI